MAMIRLSHVTKNYRSGGRRVAAIADMSVEVPGGSIVLLTGKNGSGKSTLLSLMCGIISPTSGRVYFDGHDISRLPERFLARMRREKMGIISQERYLVSKLSVMENLVLPLVPTPLSSKNIFGKGEAIIKKFGLNGKEKIRVSRLSGGEKQRLIIARALINNPNVIFADEPTTHLDEDVLNVLSTEIMDWKAQGKTIILASHQPDLFGNINADLTLHLEKGRRVRRDL